MYNDAQAENLYQHGTHVTGVVTIQRDAMTLYTAWRSLENLQRFIDDLISVEVIDEKNSRWTTRGPAGAELTWLAELIRDEPGKVLAWKTTGEPDVPNAGTVRFRELPHGRGTEVRVTLEYVPPGGRFGDAAAKALGDDAKTKIQRALFGFRQVMETGELAISSGQPAGANRLRTDRAGESERLTDDDVRDIAAEEPTP